MTAATKIIGESASVLFNLARFSQENISGDSVSNLVRKREARYESALLIDLGFKNKAYGLDILEDTIRMARKNISNVCMEEFSVDRLDSDSRIAFEQMTTTHADMLLNVLGGLATIFNTLQNYENDTTVFEYPTKKKMEELYVCIDILAYTILNSKMDLIEGMYQEFVGEYNVFLEMLNQEKEEIVYPIESIVNY